MATRNNRKLAALNKEKCEEHLRSNLAKNSKVARSQEDYISQFSEDIEGKVAKKLSQEFSRTENRIIGALAHLDDFLRNPLIQGHSGTGPETSQNIFSINQGTNEDDSQSNLHPKSGLSTNQVAQNSGPEDGHNMVTGVQKESLYGHDMLTGATEQIRNCHDMAGNHEDVTYCSPCTSSGKHKKNRSTSQPQFHKENARAMIEADLSYECQNS